ncbi:MAG: ion transporter [Cyanobacteria bacterium J06626_14]
MISPAERSPFNLNRYLDDIDDKPGRVLNLAIAILVLVSSVIFIIETYPLGEQVRTSLTIANRIILVIFAIEYGLRLWIADNKRRYLLSPYSLIDLVAILPFFLGVLDISFVLIFRWFRILRLFRFIKGHTIFGYVSSEDGTILTRILFTLFAIVFVYSGLIYQVEHPVNSDEFRTFLDALYFAVATMTTVGFGDITPISELGRLLTILMIWSGITLIPWQIGDLVKRLLKTSRKVEVPCPNCNTEFHDNDAQFCRVCGTVLPHVDHQ